MSLVSGFVMTFKYSFKINRVKKFSCWHDTCNSTCTNDGNANVANDLNQFYFNQLLSIQKGMSK